jgi:hypothetical protein
MLYDPARSTFEEARSTAESLAERIQIEDIWRIAAGTPEEWYESDHVGLHRPVDTCTGPVPARTKLRSIRDINESEQVTLGIWPLSGN